MFIHESKKLNDRQQFGIPWEKGNFVFVILLYLVKNFKLGIS